MCNAPNTFERPMETVLQELQCNSLVYLHDVVIFDKTARIVRKNGWGIH